MVEKPLVHSDDIEAARSTIADKVRVTPTAESSSLGKIAGAPVHLKFEHTQLTGSFKLRGATNAISRLGAPEKARGVVAVSTGNHGRGLAYAAAQANVRCLVCMSKLVPRVKVDAIRGHGAEVIVVGSSQDEAQEEVDRLVREEGMTLVPPFDDRDVIAGQGTLGLELADQLPRIDTVIVPLSGGGLISGVAAAVKSRLPQSRIVGVSMERGAAMHASQRAGHPVKVEELPSLADSLGGGIGIDNRFTYAMVRSLVDDIVLVSEAEIADGMRHAYLHERQVIEGAAAVGIAAILAGKIRPRGKRAEMAVILSGANVDMNQHLRIVSGEFVDVAAEAA